MIVPSTGSHSGIFCSAHKLENMVDVRNRHCAHPECSKCPSFNYAGKTPGLYCGLHKLEGMVDVKHKRDRSLLSISGEMHSCKHTGSLMHWHACSAHALYAARQGILEGSHCMLPDSIASKQEQEDDLHVC